MLLLIANAVYHSFQIPRAETNDAVTGLPIQQLPIFEFVIHIVRTRAFYFSDPITDEKCWRDCHRNVNVRFSAADFMKD